MGGWLWRTSQAGQRQIEEELYAAARLELQAAVQGQAGLAADLTADEASSAWRSQYAREQETLRTSLLDSGMANQATIDVHTLNLRNDVAVAAVDIKAGARSYRQTRFYRRTTVGWLRIAPDATLWGPTRRLETDYFAVRYRQRDAEAVTEFAKQLDALYTSVARNLGWSALANGQKFVVEVSVTHPPGSVAAWRGADDPLLLASPALYLAPAGVSDSDLLVQAITLPLLEQALAQARVLPRWNPLLDGLRLWQLWDLALPLATWQDEVIHWVFVDVASADNESFGVLPEHYSDLCILYQLWLGSPAQLQIPLLCGSVGQSEWEVVLRYLRTPAMRLNQLDVSQVWREERPEVQRVLHTSLRPGEAVALATLIDYAVETYGQERLPLLVAALGEYDHWGALLPVVYGVSPSEFERGWQTYLTMQYGIDQFR
jgi:hypothetical protein